MDRRAIAGLIVLIALTACSVQSGKSPDPAVNANATSEQVAGGSEVGRDMPDISQSSSSVLPDDACTYDGYWTFFEAFVQSPEVRAAHTADVARAAIRPFRIALVDDRWYYVDEGKAGQARQPLDLKENREGGMFRVEYVRAEFDDDDEVVKTYGRPGAYVFNYVDGCWQLTQSTD